MNWRYAKYIFTGLEDGKLLKAVPFKILYLSTSENSEIYKSDINSHAPRKIFLHIIQFSNIAVCVKIYGRWIKLNNIF